MGPADVPELGGRLFAFAILSDTHVNESEDSTTSPYAANALANRRARFAIHRINRDGPEFLVHLGDLTHPPPVLPGYPEAARRFRGIAAELRCPIHVMPGNHDVGDKPFVGGPAPVVTAETVSLWRENFGPDFHSFDHGGVHFVALDAQILGSGLPAEEEQRRWLEADLAANVDRRSFWFLHYPPFTRAPDEPEAYDNLGPAGRAWILDLVRRHRPQAVFSGHVHVFSYNRVSETDFYVLPSTSFVRPDYSELFRVAPSEGGAGPLDEEGGRNERQKLGYFLVSVHEKGYAARRVQTGGETLDEGARWIPREAVSTLLPIENPRAPLGVDLRHPWAEIVEIPPMGALDEFSRKKARNDYPLLALADLGIRKLRVPLEDLADPETHERMRLLRRLGHEFTVYTLGVPQGRDRDALVGHAGLVEAWEVVAPGPDVARTIAEVREIRRSFPAPILLSKLRGGPGSGREGARFHHIVEHGFEPGERAELEALLARPEAAGVVDGFVFRVARRASPWEEIAAVGRLVSALIPLPAPLSPITPDSSLTPSRPPLRAAVLVRMAADRLGERCNDDLANANRAAEALVAALGLAGPGRPKVAVFLDTFADNDRGYFVRAGLVDRRYNLRLAGFVVAHLHAALNSSPGPIEAGARREIPSGRILGFNRGGAPGAVVLPEGELSVEEFAADGGALETDAGEARLTDLGSGEIRRAAWRRAGERFRLDPPARCEAPTLIEFGD